MLLYVPCILYSLLSRPINVQHLHTATCFDVPASLVIPKYKKHQHKNYTNKTVRTVYTATKLTASMYCNYNR